MIMKLRANRAEYRLYIYVAAGDGTVCDSRWLYMYVISDGTVCDSVHNRWQ